MTEENLQQAINLKKDIDHLEKMIDSCNNQKCEWIDFTFGNGSNRAMVCNDNSIIEKVKNLLISENLGKLKQLQDKFSDL